MDQEPAGDQKRESGKPGGGQGRVDVTGESGVYPGDGPWPEGDAPFVSPASWGQGDRGPEGYYDHGDSELSYLEPESAGAKTDGPAAAAASAGARGAAQSAPIEAAVEVPYHEWKGFFDGISDRYAGEIVRVEVGAAEPGWPIDSVTQRLADGLPLVGMVAEFRDASESIEIILGAEPDAQITYTVTEPTHVWFAEGGGSGLVQIESADAPSVVIRF